MESEKLIGEYRGYEIYKLYKRDRESYRYVEGQVVSSVGRVKAAIDEAFDNPMSASIIVDVGTLVVFPFKLKDISFNGGELRDSSSIRFPNFETCIMAVF